MAQAKQKYTKNYWNPQLDDHCEWIDGWLKRRNSAYVGPGYASVYDGWCAAELSKTDYWDDRDEPDTMFLAEIYIKAGRFELVCRHTNNMKKIVLPIGVYQGTGSDANDFAAYAAAELQRVLHDAGDLSENDWVESSIISVDGTDRDLFELELLICEVL